MWLRILHQVGLTNLSDDEVEAYYSVPSGESAPPQTSDEIVWGETASSAFPFLGDPEPASVSSQWRLSVDRRVLGDVELVIPEDLQLVSEAIGDLASDPTPPDVTRFSVDQATYFRLQRRGYSIIYTVREQTVMVVAVRESVQLAEARRLIRKRTEGQEGA